MIKILMAITLLGVCSLSNADEKLKVPDISNYKKDGYPFKFHYFHEDKNQKDIIIYGFDYITDGTTWMGACERKSVKGLNSIGCTIFSEPTNFSIFVTDGKKELFFDYDNFINKKDGDQEVNFRLNGGEIETIPVNYILDKMGAKVIISDFASRSKLEYSIKTSKGYKTYKYNLMGLRQAIEFAEKIIKENR